MTKIDRCRLVAYRALRSKSNCTVKDYNNLIKKMAEKISFNPSSIIRYGQFMPEDAVICGWVLSSSYDSPCLPIVEGNECNSYYADQGRLDIAKSQSRHALNTAKSIGVDHCLLASGKRWTKCDCCGKQLRQTNKYSHRWSGYIVEHEYAHIKYINGWGVCDDLRCRTIARLFTKKNLRNGREQLSAIIMEITHEKNRENHRRLTQYFV